MIQLTVDNVLRTMEEVVSEYGADYVYRTDSSVQCVYVADGEPSCLVGHVLHRLGVPTEALFHLGDRSGVSQDAKGLVHALVREGYAAPVPSSPFGPIAVLMEAQWRQDTGSTWGEALAAARKAACRR